MSITPNNIPKGTKLYRYEGDKLIVIRVLKHSNGYYDCKIIEGKTTDLFGEGILVKDTEINDEYVTLKEDGIVGFSVLQCEKKDVMVTIHRKEDANDPIPFALCRQDVVDIFKMYSNPPQSGYAWAGISVNRNNCPAEMKMEDFMLCDDILRTEFINIYLDDTLDDILNLVFLDRYNNILARLKKFREGSNIIGNCSTLRELLETHNFMYDFHEAFGITEVPFLINNDTKHLLIDIIGQMIQKVVREVYIIPYDKTINTKEFERPYMLMTPDWSKCKKEDQKIFIIGYDVDDKADYLVSKYGTNNKEEILQQLGFNVM